MEDKKITVEMGGERITLDEKLLNKAIQTSEEMKELALKAGWTKEEAEKLFGMRIVKDKE